MDSDLAFAKQVKNLTEAVFAQCWAVAHQFGTADGKVAEKVHCRVDGRCETLEFDHIDEQWDSGSHPYRFEYLLGSVSGVTSHCVRHRGASR